MNEVASMENLFGLHFLSFLLTKTYFLFALCFSRVGKIAFAPICPLLALATAVDLEPILENKFSLKKVKISLKFVVGALFQ